MTHPHWYLPTPWATKMRAALGGVIDLDPCAARPELDQIQALVAYLWPERDGLALPWSGSVYCNPPYDRVGVRAFADKAIAEAPNCRALAMLVPLAPTARWWRDLARHAELCVLLSQRIAFIDGSDGGDPKVGTGRGDLCVFGWRLAAPAALKGIVVPRIMECSTVTERPQQVPLAVSVERVKRKRGKSPPAASRPDAQEEAHV